MNPASSTPETPAGGNPDPAVHSLRGRVAIITGASRGIGRAIALAYARAGAAVVVNHAPDQAVPQDLLDLIRSEGGRAVAVQADISQPAAHAPLVEAALTHFGRVDILVNNAAVNLKGPYFLAQRVAREMIRAGTRGRIINVTSNHEAKALRGSSVYSISKSGLGMLTKVLALELAPHGITVNSLVPGSYATHMNREAMLDPERRAAAGRSIPLGRLGEPEDLVAAAIFLAGPHADYVTGTSLRVDGGLGLV